MIKHSEKSLSRPTNDFMAPHSSDAALLEAGMVITVEPGICMFGDGRVTARSRSRTADFSRYALERVYPANPEISQFIVVEVLQRYMHVGGVRIEDDILITKHKYENLTLTPKGEGLQI